MGKSFYNTRIRPVEKAKIVYDLRSQKDKLRQTKPNFFQTRHLSTDVYHLKNDRKIDNAGHSRTANTMDMSEQSASLPTLKMNTTIEAFHPATNSLFFTS